MATTFLSATFKDKESVKALGARWDPNQKQWFVPEGRDLTAFSNWLPEGSVLESQTGLAVPPVVSTEVAVVQKGVPLSQLLAGVSQAVA